MTERPIAQPDTDTFVSIETSDLVDRVEAQLIHAIVAGRLAPGARIVEADIARRMGISRAPVREAARRLERQGILMSRPRHGFNVRTITIREIDELYQVRMSLELMAVGLACKHADEAGLVRLIEAVEHMVADAESLSQSERVVRDLAFHTTICELSGNGYLSRLFSNMRTELRMIMALIETAYQDPKRVAATHQPIMAALEARDVAVAQDAMRVHLEDARQHVRAMFIQQHGEQIVPSEDRKLGLLTP